jgi:acetolactate synthase-1/2/3 large subunit
MKGSQYVAQFLKAIGANNVFVVQGGACAFMLDAVASEPGMKYTCFQHEQAAAMAADALWRTNKQLGVTFCTSGPGASNLITGIACGYYDSIPSLHITGQVNYEEQKLYRNAPVRQAGFQQMDIVSMVRPVSKYAVAVTDHEQMRHELKRAVEEAYSGRMGPVVVDIPMNLQNAEMANGELLLPEPTVAVDTQVSISELAQRVTEFLAGAQRPLVIFGAGVGLAGTNTTLESWLNKNDIPFVSTWASLNYFNHDTPNYIGHFGVYGNRGGNFAIQNADRILVLGSRLDNRQRSGNPNNFAPHAKIFVVDLDPAELEKLDPSVPETNETLRRVKAEIYREIEEVGLSEHLPEPVIVVIEKIAQSWEKVAKIEPVIESEVLNKLELDQLCRNALVDVLPELVFNGIKHGKATDFRIELNHLAESDVVRLVITDNGNFELVESVTGVGTRILNESCISWNRIRKDSKTVTTADFAFSQ